MPPTHRAFCAEWRKKGCLPFTSWPSTRSSKACNTRLNFFLPSSLNFLRACMVHLLLSWTSPTYNLFIALSSWISALLWPIMQLPLALLLASATVAVALPEIQTPEGSNLHQATRWRWPSSLRSLLVTQPNELSHQSSRSHIISRRRRSHP